MCSRPPSPATAWANSRPKPPSPRCTPTPGRPRRPTGCRSSSGTTNWCASPAIRWPASTGPSRSARPTARGPAWPPWRGSTRPCPATPPSRPTCTNATVTRPPRRGSTPKPPGQRPTSQNATTSPGRPRGSTRSCAVDRLPPAGDGARQVERGPVELALDGDVGLQLLVRVPGGGRPEPGRHLGEDGADGRLVAPGGTDVHLAAVLGAADALDEPGAFQPVKHGGNRRRGQAGRLGQPPRGQVGLVARQVEALDVARSEPEAAGDGLVQHERAAGALARDLGQLLKQFVAVH